MSTQETQSYDNWQRDCDNDGILWLKLDRKDSSANSLNRSVLEEFNAILDSLGDATDLKGLVIYSGKDSGFIAGADIEEFKTMTNLNDAIDSIRAGQQIFDKLEALKMPTVAMIKGFCLGGGLELALACDYRIAENSKSTRLGLPEVKLGIHPGWGGTVRLPNLIGPVGAMDLILSGRTLSAGSAAKMGVVDAAVPLRQLKRAARFYALNKPAKHTPSLTQKILNISPMRQIIAKTLRKKVKAKARKEHYPAPYAVIDNWVLDGAKGERAMINEANSIGKMFMTDTSRNLIRVFFLQEQLKSLAKAKDSAVQHVHVIGAGTMGGDIAAWCALRGLRVTLQDREAKYIAPAIKRAHGLYKKKLRKPRLIQEAMDRLIPDVKGDGVKRADLIIEAIFENLEAKQTLFRDVELKAKPTAILATNTSSIPLDEINTALLQPQRLVGIHFFNPVAMMPLVEVVKGQVTGDETMQQAMAFVRKIDRLPLPVKSSPGFLVNRVLMAYLTEAVYLADENIPLPAIDKAAEEFGMPMGPIELADTVGLDICLSVAKNLGEHYGGKIPIQLEERVKSGQLGKKTGRGFYTFKNGKACKEKLPENYSLPADIGRRMVARLLNEAAACVRESVVDGGNLLDAGMIFGTGFAPFRGGPMHYANSMGKEDLLELFNDLTKQYGERFKADAFWENNQYFLDKVA